MIVEPLISLIDVVVPKYNPHIVCLFLVLGFFFQFPYMTHFLIENSIIVTAFGWGSQSSKLGSLVFTHINPHPISALFSIVEFRSDP